MTGKVGEFCYRRLLGTLYITSCSLYKKQQPSQTMGTIHNWKTWDMLVVLKLNCIILQTKILGTG